MDLKTKIVATIGPAITDENKIREMYENGVRIPRFNVKHNEPAWHAEYIDKYRKIADDMGINIGILIDLQGPSIRIGNIVEEGLDLAKGDEVVLGLNEVDGLKLIPFPQIANIQSIKIGSPIKLQDGIFTLTVTDFKSGEYIKAIVDKGGNLKSNKNVNMPFASFDLPSFTEKDKKYIEMGVEKGVDYIALSFVRNKEDLINLRNYINELGGDQHIMTKFETQDAIDNMEDVINFSDAIMVARGDLGIEIPFEQVPEIQKQLIQKCRQQKKPVIVATHMIKSMVDSPVPTRAEVSDITLAVLQKTDALMLSEESSVGKYPELAVEAMARIAKHNENVQFMDDKMLFQIETAQDSIIKAAHEVLQTNIADGQIKAVIAFTVSGRTARSLSRLRPNAPIYAFSNLDRTCGTLALSKGVHAIKMELSFDPVQNIQLAIDVLKHKSILNTGDTVLVIFGDKIGVSENNNTVTLQQVN